MWPRLRPGIFPASPGQAVGGDRPQCCARWSTARAKGSERQGAPEGGGEAFRTALVHASGASPLKKQDRRRWTVSAPHQRRLWLESRSEAATKKELVAATSWCPEIHRTGAYKVAGQAHHGRDRRDQPRSGQPLRLDRAEAAAYPLASGLALAHGQRSPLSLPMVRPRARGHVHPANVHPSFQRRGREADEARFEALPDQGAAPEPGGEESVLGGNPARPPMPSAHAECLRPRPFLPQLPPRRIYRTGP